MDPLLHRIFSTKKPSYLERYKAIDSSHSARSNRPLFKILSYEFEFLKNSVYVKSSYLWNSLPSGISDNDSIRIFKNELMLTFSFHTLRLSLSPATIWI